MKSHIISFLAELGYTNIPTGAYEVIRLCDDWYRARLTDAHRRVRVTGDGYELERMAFAKRCCADDANLCEVVDVSCGGGEAQNKAVHAMLAENAFDVMYRRQLELCAAEGTVAAYWRVEGASEVEFSGARYASGGKIRLKAVEASGYVPLTVDGEDVTEAAFAGTMMEGGKRYSTLVVCTRPDGERYQYRSVVFDREFTIVRDETIALGEVKPFAVMRTAAVNTLDDMAGFGIPKILDAIPILTGLDKAFTVLLGDIDTADKIVLINEVLCGFEEGEDGVPKPIPPNEQMKRRFVFYGRDKLPDEKSVVKEIVPEIRTEQFERVIALLLSLLSMMFGYGTRKYAFEQGRVTTATQYMGERQDQMQELLRQQKEAKRYVRELVRAGLWFKNEFGGQSFDVDAEVLVDFDDSYIHDTRTKLEDMRADVVAGIGGVHVRARYLQARYNLDEETAKKWASTS